MNKFREFVMKDIGWKLLSVVIAMGLWFMVINIENPIETRSFSVPIVLENNDKILEKDFILVNERILSEEKANIKVRGQRISLDMLSQNRNKIKAVADLSEALDTDGSAPVPIYIDIELPHGSGDVFEVVSKSPQYVLADVQKKVSAEYPVEVKITGEIPNEYVVVEPAVTPAKVTVSGPKSTMEKVSTVKVILNANEIVSGETMMITPMAYDSNGTKIEGVTISEKEIAVNTGINKTKRVPIVPQVKDIPSDGYSIGDISCYPDSIEITGTGAVLANIQSINLKAISVAGADAEIEEEISVSESLPVGATIVGEQNQTVLVRIAVSKEAQKHIVIGYGQIKLTGNVGDGKNAYIDHEDISITVTGNEDDLLKIKPEAISGVVDVTNLSLGRHTMDVIVSLPSGVEIVGEAPTVDVIVAEQSDTGIGTPPDSTQNIAPQ